MFNSDPEEAIGGGGFVAILIIVAVASFVASVITVRTNQPVAFFMIHARAWELATGGLISFAPHLKNRWLAEACRLAGLLLIAASVVLIGRDQPFPGERALAPVVGAALIIWPSIYPTLGSRLLSLKPVVGCGLISYSLYLWHWPIACLARHISLNESFDQKTAIGLFVLSVILAIGTYYLVEQPFRKGLRLATWQVFSGSAVIGAILVALAGTVVATAGLPQRLNPDVLSLAQGAKDYSRYRARCHRTGLGEMKIEDSCIFGAKVAPTIAMWADSHGMELSDAIGESLRDKHASILNLTYSACAPSLGFSIPERPKCSKFNDDALAYLVDHQDIRTVIVTAYYRFYEHYNADEFYAGIDKTVAALSEAGKQVIIVGPTPIPPYRVPQRAAKMRLVSDQPLSIPLSLYLRQNSRALKEIAKVSALPNVTYVDAAASFCDENRCLLTDGGKSYYSDDHHLSMHGARKLAGAIPVGLNVDRLSTAMPLP